MQKTTKVQCKENRREKKCRFNAYSEVDRFIFTVWDFSFSFQLSKKRAYACY